MGMADSERITPPWWLKPMNKVFMTVMRLGIMKDGPVVLTVPGRKSGKPRSTPITPFTVDGKRYVVGGFPGADWVRNARAADVATLTQGRSAEPVPSFLTSKNFLERYLISHLVRSILNSATAL